MAKDGNIKRETSLKGLESQELGNYFREWTQVLMKENFLPSEIPCNDPEEFQNCFGLRPTESFSLSSKLECLFG